MASSRVIVMIILFGGNCIHCVPLSGMSMDVNSDLIASLAEGAETLVEVIDAKMTNLVSPRLCKIKYFY